MPLSFYSEPDSFVSKRIFQIEVLAHTNVTNSLCEGILKRIFSKQICYSYRVLSFSNSPNGFVIRFRFVCWNSEGQRKRYLTFDKMNPANMEQDLENHKNKTLDGFCGEFFKRLKKGSFKVEIDGKEVIVKEFKSIDKHRPL